ncbi:VanZ family protein [Candidatus Parcubacteria bacterium]|nr:VanZ family protein [Candidatus Parcubacteria bacterium]
MTKKLAHWLAIIAWVGIIFYFSHQPDLKSSLPDFWDLIFRKIAHISEYAVLSFLLMKTFIHHKITRKNAAILTLIIAASYAIGDEYHQTFIAGRSGSIRDVLIDSIGIFFIAIFYKPKNIKNESLPY